MTITTPTDPLVKTHGRIDRRVDDHKDTQPVADGATASAFVIVLANHKGGVTKTTSTANLGACLAEAGRRVLLVDCDPQANLSEAFGWTEDLPGERLEDLLAHPAAAVRYAPPPALQPDVSPNLDWRERLRSIPCTDTLADVAADLPASAGDGWESRLRDVLQPLRDRFDFVLLDTPPGLGNLSGMAVLAADGLLIPARPADLDVRGAGKLYDLVETSVPDLRILGVLIAASDQRWRIARNATSRMGADQMRVLPIQIPRARAGRLSTALSRADGGAGARLDGQPRLPPTRQSRTEGRRRSRRSRSRRSHAAVRQEA
jgi:chromosome partitioning protein